jgi:hypothetical protein
MRKGFFVKRLIIDGINDRGRSQCAPIGPRQVAACALSLRVLRQMTLRVSLAKLFFGMLSWVPLH